MGFLESFLGWRSNQIISSERIVSLGARNQTREGEKQKKGKNILKANIMVEHLLRCLSQSFPFLYDPVSVLLCHILVSCFSTLTRSYFEFSLVFD